MNHPKGPACDACDTTEARCAYLTTCCSSCSHFSKMDAAGDEIAKPLGRPRTAGTVDAVVCMTCRRPIPPSGRIGCVGECLTVRRAHDRRRWRERSGKAS